MLADVLTTAGIWDTMQPLLTYQIPADLERELRPGQLVAVPYGERLVEGIVWQMYAAGPGDELIELEDGSHVPVRPIRSLLDPEPALLPHQVELAEWLSEYYVTPLAQTVQVMLPPGLMQRSQAVLRLVTENLSELHESEYGPSPRTRALIGLLLADGELNIERLKEMLGAKRAREVLKEVRESGLIVQEAQLAAPQVKPRVKNVVHLTKKRDLIEKWRRDVEEQLLQRLHEPEIMPFAPDNVRRRPQQTVQGKKGPSPDPWALPEDVVTATLTLTKQDKASLAAQRQLAAIDLLSHESAKRTYWTPNMLCKASGMTRGQLQQLVKAGLLTIEEIEIRRNPLEGRTLPASEPLPLTTEQQAALEQILAGMTREENDKRPAPRPILLHGVTGSGKTEVYLQALAAAIEQGKRGIVLVPEIALTTQAIQRVAARFPDRVAIIHSELGMGERYDEWRRIRAGEVDIVIGSRSALFAPVPDLGIIIIDEEHEPAYKQDRRPTYNAREVALHLGLSLRIPVVLGSATPSLESFYKAESQQYQLVELPSRIGGALPPVEIIDLRSELHAGNTSIISRRLREELERVLDNGQQAILFLNRRGAASCILCRDCGFVVLCEYCDIPLTYHSTERILLCHYCGQQSKVAHFCPNCRSSGIRYFGLGTEKVQETIQRIFPAARLLRWDRDTARSRHAHEQLLDRFANRDADILIGTQMIAKGLDLPGVTLVGVISADIALNLPDYTSAERAFTLLTQVAGRAGRGTVPGHVIVQTFNPNHFCIDTASRHDYHEFYHAEIDARRRYGYPPFRQFVKFSYCHAERHQCQRESLVLYENLMEWIDRLGLVDTDVVGPAPALMERVKGKYRWQMIARGPDLRRLLRVIDAPGWDVDIDPISVI